MGSVIFLDEVHEILEERLTEAGFECIHAESESVETCIELVKECVGIVIRSRFPINQNFLQYAEKLRFIARSGAGMENIDVPYCEKRGIELFNAPEGNRNAVGEHALGMLLSMFNHLNKGDREVRQGIWDRSGNRGTELDGKTVGIIGFGNNGSSFAKKLRGFDVNLLVYDKYKSGFGDEFVKECSLEEIYANSDVISFHIPQNSETIYWANDEFFGKLRKNIWLINVSRGKIVEGAALVKALKSGKVLGAALDVLEYEKASFESFTSEKPNADFEYLLKSDKVLFSPHVAGWTTESYFKLSDVLADKILKFYGI